jgi:hypothetical protein
VHHMSYSSGSWLHAGEGSRVLCVLQLWILPPCRGGLRNDVCATTPDPASLQGRAPEHHVSYGSESCIPTGRAPVMPPYALWFPVGRMPQV